MSLFTGLDWFVLAIYFFVLLGIIWWVVQQKQDSTEEYFLAGRNLGWFVIGASIFASNIGSEHIVGWLAQRQIAMVGHYELHSWIILLLGWVFVPFYAKHRFYNAGVPRKKILIRIEMASIDNITCWLYTHQSFSDSICWRSSISDTYWN